MSHPDAHELDLTTLAPPDGSPVVGAPSVKEVQRAAEEAFGTYRSSVDRARKALAGSEKDHATSVKRAEQARSQATTPAKLASIGVVRNVTLTETTIRTPKGVFALTPDVEARAEQHGNKQVVQGWVFKSDNDRREVYLHLSGPTWADVVPFSMKHSWSQPRDLHNFAAKVTAAARNSDPARARIAARVADADRARVAAILDRAAVEEAAEQFVAVTHATVALNAAAEAAKAVIAAGDPSDRSTAKAREALDAMSARAWEWADESAAARRRVSDESTLAQENTHAMVDTADVRLAPQVSAAEQPSRGGDSAPVASPVTEAPDVLDQIRRLGELRDAGLLTPDEFEAKKRDLLARL